MLAKPRAAEHVGTSQHRLASQNSVFYMRLHIVTVPDAGHFAKALKCDDALQADKGSADLVVQAGKICKAWQLSGKLAIGLLPVLVRVADQAKHAVSSP